jgi:hypothetical protein
VHYLAPIHFSFLIEPGAANHLRRPGSYSLAAQDDRTLKKHHSENSRRGAETEEVTYERNVFHAFSAPQRLCVRPFQFGLRGGILLCGREVDF